MRHIRPNKVAPKILFYTDIARGFRNYYIGYLYEIARVYTTVVLSEKLDDETNNIIRDKTLFPNIEDIIPVEQYMGYQGNIIQRHQYFSQLAKKVIETYKPDAVFATGYNIFESYLRRFAMERHSIAIACTAPLLARAKDIQYYRYLLRAHRNFPSFLPRFIKVLLARGWAYTRHILFYQLAPLAAGQKPFWKEPSDILLDVDNMEGADFYVTWLKGDRDIILKSNPAAAKKLFILSHPLSGKGREIFEKAYLVKARRKKEKNTLLIIWPYGKIGFRLDGSLISEEEMRKTKMKIICLIRSVLKGWKILIKPHPMDEDISMLKNMATLYRNDIIVIDPSDSVEKYIEISDAVLGFGRPSTALFTASLQCPKKPMLSLDFDKELLADSAKGLEGIEYIQSEKEFLSALLLIKDNKYDKKEVSKNSREGFSSISTLLKFLLTKKP